MYLSGDTIKPILPPQSGFGMRLHRFSSHRLPNSLVQRPCLGAGQGGGSVGTQQVAGVVFMPQAQGIIQAESLDRRHRFEAPAAEVAADGERVLVGIPVDVPPQLFFCRPLELTIVEAVGGLS